MKFALNHIAAPKQSLANFFGMARSLGIVDVEIRNDLKGSAISDGTPPEAVRDAAADAGVSIISINALYPFNVWSAELEKKAVALADYAQTCGARALVMCPLNEGKAIAHVDLVNALNLIKPILADRGLTGLVEPLGFPVSSLRTKAEAVEAIGEADGADIYKLVHDTFHHHLAGEKDYFVQQTGLVHLSGVTDRALAVDSMLDDHRVLVDREDRLENIAQIKALVRAGYEGPFSFEPFSPMVQTLSDPAKALADSINFIQETM